MKLYPLAKIILDIITQRFVLSVRPGTRTENCFLRLEIAIYYLAIGNEDEAIKNYERARELSSHKDKGFRAFILISFANWKYKLGQYREALRMYREIENMLEKEGSSLIKAQTHYQLSCTYLRCNPPNREKAIDNLHKAERICRELELPLLVEVMKLKEILEAR
jgi:tetratricopeptide (TPR) repeat protein